MIFRLRLLTEDSFDLSQSDVWPLCNHGDGESGTGRKECADGKHAGSKVSRERAHTEVFVWTAAGSKVTAPLILATERAQTDPFVPTIRQLSSLFPLMSVCLSVCQSCGVWVAPLCLFIALWLRLSHLHLMTSHTCDLSQVNTVIHVKHLFSRDSHRDGVCSRACRKKTQ